MPGGRFDETEQHLPPTASAASEAADTASPDDAARQARRLSAPIRWIRTGSAYQAMAALLVIGVTASLLTGDSAPEFVPAPDAPVELAVPDESQDPRLVYPVPDPRGRLDRKRAPKKETSAKGVGSRKRVARRIELAPGSSAPAPSAPAAAPPAPARQSDRARKPERRDPKPAEPAEPAPPTPTRTLYRLTKPNGHYFFTIDTQKADEKEATEGWDKVRLAFVWGDWEPGMRGLFTSDGTRAYVFIRKKLAPSGIAPLWWAGGNDGPFYCFVKDECTAVGDTGWYGYADPI